MCTLLIFEDDGINEYLTCNVIYLKWNDVIYFLNKLSCKMLCHELNKSRRKKLAFLHWHFCLYNIQYLTPSIRYYKLQPVNQENMPDLFTKYQIRLSVEKEGVKKIATIFLQKNTLTCYHTKKFCAKKKSQEEHSCLRNILWAHHPCRVLIESLLFTLPLLPQVNHFILLNTSIFYYDALCNRVIHLSCFLFRKYLPSTLTF